MQMSSLMFEDASRLSGPLSSLHIPTKVGLFIADLLPGSLQAAADGLFSSLHLLPFYCGPTFQNPSGLESLGVTSFP